MMAIVWTYFLVLVFVGVCLLVKTIKLTLKWGRKREWFFQGYGDWSIAIYGVSGGLFLYFASRIKFHNVLRPWDEVAKFVGLAVILLSICALIYGSKLGEMIEQTLMDED
ncbi:hypothetical protein H0W91_00040 [Patescibacteria group bacterium]|nr:hypothetical protein [Patescibacteria group bacterium]